MEEVEKLLQGVALEKERDREDRVVRLRVPAGALGAVRQSPRAAGAAGLGGSGVAPLFLLEVRARKDE